MADYQMNAVNLAQQDHEINEVNSAVLPAPREQDDQVNTEPLRNASPLPESDTESEDQQDEIEEAPVALAYPNQITWQRVTIEAFLWIQFIWRWLSYLSSKTAVVTTGVVRSLQSKTYVFFQGSNYPYRLQEYSLAGPGVAPVEWFFDADKKVFLDSRVYNTPANQETHHFEWLSGEIRYNDLMLYDISDFLEEIKWGGAQKPSPSRVLAAWSLHSGIVLNGKDGLVLHTINEDGSESNLPISA